MPDAKPSAATAVETGIDQEVGARLKAAREERGFTQGAIAVRSKALDPEKKGISRTAIIGYEQGTTRPGLREIRLLCEVLRVSPNWLIYGTDAAPVASLPSMELLPYADSNQLDGVFRSAVAMMALKGHERDALQSLLLSLAGRQLGDIRLSALMSITSFMRETFITALKAYAPDIQPGTPLEQVAEFLSQGYRTNQGNRFRFDEEGEILNPEQAVYPDPKPSKLGNSTNS